MRNLLMLLLVVTLVSCNNQTKQSIIKTDDELSANIEHLFEKYVNNDFDVSDYYADDIVCKINNIEFSGYDNLIPGFKAHHDVLYDNINIEDMYIHTNYFADGEIWSNAWFTWTGIGKTTGNEYSNRGHFDYKWKDGKIVELLAYYSETAEMTEAAAYEAANTED